MRSHVRAWAAGAGGGSRSDRVRVAPSSARETLYVDHQRKRKIFTNVVTAVSSTQSRVPRRAARARVCESTTPSRSSLMLSAWAQHLDTSIK